MHTILVVDDNKNILDFSKRELEREGYRVLVAREAREASEIVDAEVPDLVVVSDDDPLDTDFTSFINRLGNRDVPIIVYAASELDAADMPFWRAEACVEKTGDVAELGAKIAEALKRREAGRAGDSVDDEPVGPDGSERRPWDEEGIR